MPYKQSIILLSLLWAIIPLSAETRSPGTPDAATGRVLFVENVGQFARDARFQVWGGGQTLWLADDAIWLQVVEHVAVEAPENPPGGHLGRPRERTPASGVNVRLSFPGANPHPVIEPFERLAVHVSYFVGGDPAGWHTDVPVWGGIRYRDLYPHVDLEISDLGGRIVQRFVAGPGADLNAVRVQVEGATVTGITGGLLKLATPAGALILPLPDADFPWAVTGSVFNGSQATWRVEVGRASVVAAGFADGLLVGTADNPAALLYSTYLGGGSQDMGRGIALDAAGGIYVTGNTFSGDFPTTPGAFDGTPWLLCNSEPCPEAFVVKLNPAGSEIVYATFLGGRGWENSRAIAVDAAGHAYITGQTNAPDFPVTTGAFDTSFNWGYCIFDVCPDAFVVKLNPTGSGLVYSTFVGGASYPGGADGGSDIALDGEGNAYVTGDTSSTDFPTTPGAFDRTLDTERCNLYGGVCYDGFVLKLNADGSALEYATFLGGAKREMFSAIAVDSAGSAYVTGQTYSDDFPATPAAFDTSLGDPYYPDAFVARLNAAGSGLVYATFLGGSDFDGSAGIALDGAGSAYVTGYTYSADFPTTPGAFDRSHNGQTDAFVAKLDPTGSELAYATFVGGKGTQFSNGYDQGTTIAVDQEGRAYVGGQTNSSDFPVTPGAFDRSYSGQYDAFVTRLNPTGSRLEYGTFLGGSLEEYPVFALDGAGTVYVAGHTFSNDFPVTSGALTPAYQGGASDAFIARLQLDVAYRHSLWLPMVVNRP